MSVRSLNEAFVRKKMGVVGVRLLHELNGIRCHEVDNQPQPKQNICTSRSFPQDIGDYDELRAAVATHATRCAEKLRTDGSAAGVIQVFLISNPFRNVPQFSPCIPMEFKTATNSTRAIVKRRPCICCRRSTDRATPSRKPA